jgi:hypothetical protein
VGAVLVVPEPPDKLAHVRRGPIQFQVIQDAVEPDLGVRADGLIQDPGASLNLSRVESEEELGEFDLAQEVLRCRLPSAEDELRPAGAPPDGPD